MKNNGLSAYVPTLSLTNVPINGGVSSPGVNNSEVCLDIEMVLALAPGVNRIFVYEAPNGTAWSTVMQRIANDNFAKQISCSWGGGSRDYAVNTAFKQMASQGQSFFNASGDNDAWTNNTVPFLMDNTNITLVGGTILTTSGNGSTAGGYVSEIVWNLSLIHI